MFGVEGSMTKLFASETYKRHARSSTTSWERRVCSPTESPEAHLGGRIEEASVTPP